ncbi:unnamed protein product [Symbiodinium sp. CCMP2456]|nr:unnamed protein product [Symbiodinium sp. CCMP2456]
MLAALCLRCLGVIQIVLDVLVRLLLSTDVTGRLVADEARIHDVLETALDCAPGAPDGIMDRIVALRPQRFEGYLSAIRFPSILLASLHDFIVPLTSHDDEPLRIYVGCRSYPWPEVYESVCVIHRGHRFCVREHHHYGSTIIEHVARSLRLDVNLLVACTFMTPGLDVQGWYCPRLVTFVDRPPLVDGEATRARHDVFTLCDLRPLGFKPEFMHTNVPKLHVPSLLSNFQIELPSTHRIGIIGGQVEGDYVEVQGCSTLLFYAISRGPGASSGGGHLEMPSPVNSGVLMAVPEWTRLSPPPATDDDLDTTIPAGHSWNVTGGEIASPWSAAPPAAFEQEWGTNDGPVPAASPPSAAVELGPLPVELSFSPMTDVVSSSAGALGDRRATVESHASAVVRDEEHGPTKLCAFVYAPDFAPEMLQASAFLPCSVDTAMAAFAAARTADAVANFPNMAVVSPQPFSDCIVAVAAPGWLASKAIVLFDCRGINRALFARVLDFRINRESLLLAAGLPGNSVMDVYVHGLVQPLHAQQSLTLVNGMLTSFVTPALGAPATFEIAEQLSSSECWSANAEIPGPGSVPEQFFWILTDGQPTRFEVQPGRRSSFRADLAQHLLTEERRLTLRPSVPRIIDGFLDGFLTSGVIVATEHVQRLPMPPARFRDPRLIIFAMRVMCFRDLCGSLRNNPLSPFAELLRCSRQLAPRSTLLLLQVPMLLTRRPR